MPDFPAVRGIPLEAIQLAALAALALWCAWIAAHKDDGGEAQ